MLIGLGLGPGEPEYLTLRAVRLLEEADMVFVPGRIAFDLVAPYREAEILEFPMTGDEDVIAACMDRNADRIALVAADGTAVLGLIGDPNFFSTYSRLCDAIRVRHPAIVCRTEPAISSITAFASVAGVSLSEGFLVTDGPDEVPCRIQLKVKRPRETAARLRERGYRSFILVERMYMGDTRVYRDQELPEESDYMSILYARR
ncbi:MAG: cobalt-factor II C(20)-methyltransferase [Methanomicrobiales archaeon]|nr:cobalt-factor II C(20)-methyltransferase [Methanomicrobiales archaeon]